MTTSFAIFLAFCILGCDFMLYVLFHFQYGEKRARRSSASIAARGRADMPLPPLVDANVSPAVAKLRNPEVIPFLPPGVSAAKLYFAEGCGAKHRNKAYSRVHNDGYALSQMKSRNAG